MLLLLPSFTAPMQSHTIVNHDPFLQPPQSRAIVTPSRVIHKTPHIQLASGLFGVVAKAAMRKSVLQLLLLHLDDFLPEVDSVFWLQLYTYGVSMNHPLLDAMNLGSLEVCLPSADASQSPRQRWVS